MLGVSPGYDRGLPGDRKGTKQPRGGGLLRDSQQKKGQEVIQLVSKWGVQILGEEQDLASFSNLISSFINAADSYFISRFDESYILRTSRWDDETNASLVKQRAMSELRNLQGLLSLRRRTNDLSINVVVEFDENDAIKDHTLFEYGVIPGTVQALDDNEITKLAHSNDQNIKEALFHFSADATWISIFMTYEALRSYYAGEASFHNAFPAIANDLALVRRTANRHRHAFNAKDNLSNPIDQSIALNCLRAVFKQIAADLPAPQPTWVRKSEYKIHDYTANGAPSKFTLRISGGNYVED